MITGTEGDFRGMPSTESDQYSVVLVPQATLRKLQELSFENDGTVLKQTRTVKAAEEAVAA
jgi:hypothetical protein